MVVRDWVGWGDMGADRERAWGLFWGRCNVLNLIVVMVEFYPLSGYIVYADYISIKHDPGIATIQLKSFQYSQALRHPGLTASLLPSSVIPPPPARDVYHPCAFLHILITEAYVP